MTMPTDKPTNYYITVKNAAFAARTTPKKMRECLGALGVLVDEEGEFRLANLLCAVRLNLDPVAMRATVRKSMRRSIRKAFAPVITRKPR